ncbi:hypothetical protein [Reyranella sp.]|uniref:hypothetical protein n=1 Tax=Reyranella sp. TaxID=1929291 RepID=UPI0025E6B1F1|nr:hypothetical protein [Reyranella sp.]
MTERHRFILQAYHPEYACPTFETMFMVERLDELQALLGPDARSDPEIQQLYWLEPADLVALSARFGVTFDGGDRDVALRRWHSTREPPYLVHTGYELPLLLDGRKKLARFHHEYPPHQHGWEDQFDHFVAQGLLHKEVDVEAFDKPHRHASGPVFEGLRTAWYAPKGEEWRIAAFRLIEKTKGGWNDTLERLEGMLYGYEDWQNDWWADYRRRKLSQFGTSLVYAALSPAELAAVEFAGFRSLPALDRPLPVISSFDDDLTEDERQRLGSILIRFRVKAAPFLSLMANPRERGHVMRADQIKDVNGLLLEKIEVVAQ